MNKWGIVHRNRHLVDQGLLPPLKCTICGARVHVRIDKRGDPMLRCISNHDSFPGDSWWNELDKRNRSVE